MIRFQMPSYHRPFNSLFSLLGVLFLSCLSFGAFAEDEALTSSYDAPKQTLPLDIFQASRGIPLFAPIDGAKPFYEESPVAVNGKQATSVRFSLYYHEMDLPAGKVQPSGLELFFFAIKGENASKCEAWVNKIITDESKEKPWKPEYVTYPYMEINFAKDAKPIMVNGIPTYQDSDINCWEAEDLGAPVF